MIGTLPNKCERCGIESNGEGAFALPDGWDFLFLLDMRPLTLCPKCLPEGRILRGLLEAEVKAFLKGEK